eukprot:5527016-Amphidinium_carterae.1
MVATDFAKGVYLECLGSLCFGHTYPQGSPEVQEAHLEQTLQLPRADFRAFHMHLSAHSAGHSTGGLLVLLRRSWVSLGAITPTELWPGRVLALQISWPRKQPLTLLVCHLTAEANATWREVAQVATRHACACSHPCIVLGDFNLALHVGDIVDYE